MRFPFLLCVWLAFAFTSFAQQVPVTLHPPAGEQQTLVAHAKGEQIYTCKGQDGRYAWTLLAPDAVLFDHNGRLIGRHYAGPTWEMTDNGSVTGKLVTSAASPDAQSIPWLLLMAVKHSGSGPLAGVLSIQRLNTHGGVAPLTGWGAGHIGVETRVHYTADYYFFSKAE